MNGAHSAQVVSACWRVLAEGGVDVAAGPRHLLQRSPYDRAQCAVQTISQYVRFIIARVVAGIEMIVRA
jgi:hypothetical protein